MTGFRRGTSSVAVTASTVAASLLLATLIWGCRTTPDEEPVPPAEQTGIALLEAPADGTVITTDEITISFDPGALDLSVIETILVRVAPGREYEAVPRLEQGVYRFLLPLEGLQDGNEFRFSILVRLTDGREIPVGEGFSLVLRLGLPRPEPEHLFQLTLDPRPILAWRFPRSPDPEETDDSRDAMIADAMPSGFRVTVDDTLVPVDTLRETDSAPGTDPVVLRVTRPRENLITAAAIEGGTTLTWRVHAVSPRGVLGAPSEEARLRYDPAASVPEVLSARTGDMTLVSRPGFSWSSVPGAVSYDVEYRTGETQNVTVDTTRYRLPLHTVDSLVREGPGSEIRWRVRARNSIGVRTPWSEVQIVRHTVLVPAIVPVLPVGGAVELEMGAPTGTVGARADETPPVRVTLDRPFGVARNLLTTEVVAELFNQGIRRAAVFLSDDDIVIDRITGLPLLALRNLDFGTQFGLVAERGSNADPPEPDRIGFLRDYRAHPAVGVTWYGAVWLMNRLSLLEAGQPVYRWIPDGDGYRVSTDTNADGYRLPTEAEWALAVGLRNRSPASEDARVIVYRDLSPIELRGINYLRSGDAWEDPDPPYTRSGGPTSPVGALGIASPAGIYDLLGNVWEWVWDWYDPQRNRPDTILPVNYTGPDAAHPDIYGRAARVVRGGAWNLPREQIRTTVRGSFVPGAASYSIGVRPARTLYQ